MQTWWALSLANMYLYIVQPRADVRQEEINHECRFSPRDRSIKTKVIASLKKLMHWKTNLPIHIPNSALLTKSVPTSEPIELPTKTSNIDFSALTKSMSTKQRRIKWLRCDKLILFVLLSHLCPDPNPKSSNFIGKSLPGRQLERGFC